MPPKTRLLHIRPVALMSFIGLLSAAGAALGQVIYKSTMPDGKVIYSDAPVPGAAKVESGRAPETKGVDPVTPEQQQHIEQLQSEYFSKLEAARDEVTAAEAQYKQATAARKAGREPLPIERQGRASGGSQLTMTYFERQQMLGESQALQGTIRSGVRGAPPDRAALTRDRARRGAAPFGAHVCRAFGRPWSERVCYSFRDLPVACRFVFPSRSRRPSSL